MNEIILKSEYNIASKKRINTPWGTIHSFEKGNNIDDKTVASFGEEWLKFNEFSDKEIEKIGNEYFDICLDVLPDKSWRALDVGCGSGRWTRFLAPKVGFVEAVDPSEAVFVANKNLSNLENTRVTQADVSNLPFAKESFDFVFSLGVLHHVPDPFDAIKKCVEMIKPGGRFLVYLYYALENRGFLYRNTYYLSNLLRLFISKLPSYLKKPVCDAIAVGVYLPLIYFTKLKKWLPFFKKFLDKIPLSYYSDKSFVVIRNDALDRFGTPIEKRFSKKEIYTMLTRAGLIDIKFSDKPPYWHATGKKA
jgi:SAM-dependent methyltransferase